MRSFNREDVSSFIVQLRQSKGISQEEMGKLLHVSSRTVRNWEKSVSMPSMEDIVNICNEFNVSLEEVFEGKFSFEKEVKREISEVKSGFEVVSQKVFSQHRKIESLERQIGFKQHNSKVLIKAVIIILIVHLVTSIMSAAFLSVGAINNIGTFLTMMFYVGAITFLICRNKDSSSFLTIVFIYLSLLIVCFIANYWMYSRKTILLYMNTGLIVANGPMLGIGYLAPYDKSFIFTAIITIYAVLFSCSLYFYYETKKNKLRAKQMTVNNRRITFLVSLLLVLIYFIPVFTENVYSQDTSSRITISLESYEGENYEEYEKNLNEIISVLDEYREDTRVLYFDYGIKKQIYTHNFRSDSTNDIFKGGISITDKDGRVIYKRIGGKADLAEINGNLNRENWTLINQFPTEIIGVSNYVFYDLINGNSRLSSSSSTDHFHDGMVCMVNRHYSSFISDEGNICKPEIGDVIKMVLFLMDDNGVLTEHVEYEFTIVGFYFGSGDERISSVYVPVDTLMMMQREYEQLCRQNGYYLFSESWYDHYDRFDFDDLKYIGSAYMSGHEKEWLYLDQYYRNSCMKYEYGVIYPASTDDGWEIVRELEDNLSAQDVTIMVQGEMNEMKASNISWLGLLGIIFFIYVSLLSNRERRMKI